MKFLRISDILVDRLAAVKGTVLVHLVPYNILHSLPLHLILVLYFLFYSLIIHGEEESSTKQHYDTLKIEDSALNVSHTRHRNRFKPLTYDLLDAIYYMETLTNFAVLACIQNLVSLESIQISVITINKVHHAFRVGTWEADCFTELCRCHRIFEIIHPNQSNWTNFQD